MNIYVTKERIMFRNERRIVMIGLIGLNWFNQNNTVGRDLWAIALAEGGGNPGLKHNPIYVREEAAEIPETEEVEETEPVIDEEEAEDVSEDSYEASETEVIYE